MLERESRYEKYSDQWLVERFLKKGSIEEALKEGYSFIPFSYITFRRKLDSYGIIRSPGRHTSLTEALHFFRLKALEPQTPLTHLYEAMPHSFKTSLMTLHRIYERSVKPELKKSRRATALVIYHHDSPGHILVGIERTTNIQYGKFSGNLTIPMTFSTQSEPASDRVLRVLQQEVLANEAIAGKFKDDSFCMDLLESVDGPFMIYNILDIRVDCFRVTLPRQFSDYSSFKIGNIEMRPIDDMLNMDSSEMRAGVNEILKGSLETKTELIPEVVSSLNYSLSGLEEGSPVGNWSDIV